MKCIFTLFLVGGIFSHSFAQISITPNPNAVQIVNQLQGSGVQISNVQIFADTISYGLFQGNSELPMSNGLALTSGNVLQISGHCDSILADTVLFHNNTIGWSELIDVDSAATFDYTRISFTIVPVGDTLNLSFCFASEDYTRFVNDACGIHITGPNPSSGQYDTLRLSRVVGGPSAISVMNVNSFVWQPYLLEYWVIPAANFSYRAGTVRIEKHVPVVPGQPYYISLSVADAVDGNYDAGLFVESFWSDSTLTVEDPGYNPEVNVFPNPASDKITVSWSQGYSPEKVVLTDALGRVMEEKNVTGNNTTFDMANYPVGLYFVRIESVQDIIYRKVIKE